MSEVPKAKVEVAQAELTRCHESDFVIVLQGLNCPERGGFGPAEAHPWMKDADARASCGWGRDPGGGVELDHGSVNEEWERRGNERSS
jgi:hypothetical protein